MKPGSDSDLQVALLRLRSAKAAVVKARTVYDKALYEREQIEREVNRLQGPPPRTDFPLAG